jgi:hypothetical protein
MSANTPAKLPYPRWRRADRGALKDPEAVMVELAEYAAPVIFGQTLMSGRSTPL